MIFLTQIKVLTFVYHILKKLLLTSCNIYICNPTHVSGISAKQYGYAIKRREKSQNDIFERKNKHEKSHCNYLIIKVIPFALKKTMFKGAKA